MTQPKFAAQFAAETATLGRITSVALVASGVLTLVTSGFLALPASGFLALVASVLILRGCRGLDIRRGSDLRRFGPRRPRFRGRGRPSACRTKLFFHKYHASGYGRAVIAAPSPSKVNHDRPRAYERAYGADLRLCGWLVRTVKSDSEKGHRRKSLPTFVDGGTDFRRWPFFDTCGPIRAKSGSSPTR